MPRAQIESIPCFVVMHASGFQCSARIERKLCLVVPLCCVKHALIFSVALQIESIPCSVVVWATGIKSRPIIESMRQTIGLGIQNNFRGLVTDRHLEVALPSVTFLVLFEDTPQAKTSGCANFENIGSC